MTEFHYESDWRLNLTTGQIVNADNLPVGNGTVLRILEQQDREIEQLKADLHDAGDGDTWRAADQRCEQELAEAKKQLDSALAECNKLSRMLEKSVRYGDRQKLCVWRYDATHYKYDTSCGEAWQFSNDGDVRENCVQYCPFCGGRVSEAARAAGGGE